MGDTPDTNAGVFSLPLTSYSPRGGNGRVNLAATVNQFNDIQSDGALGDGRKSGTAFPGFDYQKTSESSFQIDMMRGNWEISALSEAFFSQANITVIQNSIRRYVYDRSTPKGYLIDDQSVDELKIIMRAIFYQYARNLPYDIAGQIAELNQRVIDWSGPHILSAVDHYIYYLKDIDTMPVPMAHPVLLSRAGSKTLPQQPFM